MVTVKSVLDMRGSTVHHGSTAACPSPISGRCMGHEKPRVLSFAVQLDAVAEGELMRASGCTQVNAPFALEALIAAAIAEYLTVGARGLRADALANRGDIEIGRPAGL